MPYKSKEDKNRNAREYYRKSHSNYEKLRNRRLKKDYNITLDQYKEMFLAQKGLCQTCGTPPTKTRCLQVDHDHLTGKVRGLLCFSCNTALGGAKDNIDTLKNLIHYLKEHKNSS